MQSKGTRWDDACKSKGTRWDDALESKGTRWDDACKVKELDGMMLAKVKEQDVMVLARVKEQDRTVLAKVKVPSIPTVSGLIAVMTCSYTVSFYNRQLLHQTMSSFSIQAADVVILRTLSYVSTVLSLVRTVIHIDHLDVMSHNAFIFRGNFSFLSRSVVSMVSFNCCRIVMFSTTCEHVLVSSYCRM